MDHTSPDLLFERGNNRLKKFSLFNPREEKYEEALELFRQALIQFKLANKWQKAIEVLESMIGCYKKLKSDRDVMQSYSDIAKLYIKIENFEGAVECFQKIKQYYIEDGKFLRVADTEKEIAECYEKNSQFDRAVEMYRIASEHYDTENKKFAYHTCLEKVAICYIHCNKYESAKDTYEQLISRVVDDSVYQYKVNDILFNATLCAFLIDIIIVAGTLERYKGIWYKFEQSRECEALSKLYNAIEAEDVALFKNTLSEYDYIKSLDQLRVDLLLLIKNNFVGDDNIL